MRRSARPALDDPAPDPAVRAQLSTRGRSFGSAAESYDRLRFLPPPEAIDWLLAGDERRVLDLGAGTGQVTERLLARDLEVVAVEPDDRMRALLEARRPAATALAGTAEAIPIGDHSVDAVLVGAAWHWFDAEAASREIARVLRPGGRLGLLFTVPDVFVTWVATLYGMTSAPRADDSDAASAYTDVGLGPAFSTPDRNTIRGTRTMTQDDLVQLFTTHSEYRVAHDAERAAILDRVRAGLQSRDDPIELPTLTECWRARATRAAHGAQVVRP